MTTGSHPQQLAPRSAAGNTVRAQIPVRLEFFQRRGGVGSEDAVRAAAVVPVCVQRRLLFSFYARRARSLSYSSPLTLLNSSSSWGTVSLAFSSPEMSSTTRPLCSMMSRLP